MSTKDFINILVAEDNDVSRDMIIGILKPRGYNVYGAVDGESAIKVIEDKAIDLALVDVNMAPKGGFDFVRYAVSKGIKVQTVFITADDSNDLLMEASALGVNQIIQKPVQPDRLLNIVERILKRQGLNTSSMVVEQHTTTHAPEDLMQKALDMAAANVRNKTGGPFAAVLANAEGKVLGTGASKKSGRVDPIAHAEVMAIRNAADREGRADFSDCVLYCSSQPTAIGAALIESVGIKKVYYGMSHEDIGMDIGKRSKPTYEPLLTDKAKEMYKASKS